MKRNSSSISLFILVCLIGILLTIASSCNEKKKITFDRPTIWTLYDGGSLYRAFDAIKVKQDKSYIPDLNKYLDVAFRHEREYAMAVNLLVILGESEEITRFEDLLIRDLKKRDTPADWFREKVYALEYMEELGLKPSKNAQDSLYSLITKTGNAGAVELAAALKLHIDQFPEEIETHLRKVITVDWRNSDRYDVIRLNIQPEWETMFKLCDKKYYSRLLKFLLYVGDEKHKREYLERADLQFLPQSSKLDTNQWIAASIGDESVIKLMSEAIPGMQSAYIEENPVIFSDKTLLERLEYKKGMYESVNPELLHELNKRVYVSNVDGYIKTMGSFLYDFYTFDYISEI